MRRTALIFYSLVVIALVALGLVVLSSASAPASLQKEPNTVFHYYMRQQFKFCALGIVAALTVAAINYRHWRDHWSLTAILYVIIFALLICVFFFRARKGSYRWVEVGTITVQPSEFAKILAILATAVWLDRAGWRVELFSRGVVIPGLITMGLLVPVLLEPDFGSGVVIICAGGLMMFVAGARCLHLFPLAGVAAVVIAALVLCNPNRMNRIRDQYGSEGDNMSYQTKQSLRAFANGGVWGVGFQKSMQKHAYLPENHTDFVFAIGAEELGIPLSVVTLFLFFSMFGLTVYIANKAQDRLGRMIALGMGTLVFAQAMFNLGMVCDCKLPTKGMALPFFSYGGTNLLSTFIEVGFVLSVGIHSIDEDKRRLPSVMRFKTAQ